jgi:hypothetical protein
VIERSLPVGIGALLAGVAFVLVERRGRRGGAGG